MLVSHWASEAFRLPVTGSSAMLTSPVNARTSSASGEPAGYRPATPMSPSTSPGSMASTASALASSTATQPGPLSAHWMSTMSARSMFRLRTTRSTSSSATGPLRISGGALKARPASVCRIGISPALHSCTVTPSAAGRPPASSQA